MEKIRVMLVDDHMLFRDGVKSILLRAGERFEIVGEASDGAQAQTLALKMKPDVIVMDVQMPNCGGLQAARALAPQLPDTKIVMLTVSDRDEDLFEAIKAGAKGYLLKTSASAHDIVAALDQVAAGQVILTPTMATKLAAEFAVMARSKVGAVSPQPTEAVDDPRLTEREREVLDLVALGKTNKEIANDLRVAENTVRAHLRNILDKLHVHNRTQAAAFARRG
ncbi:MAG: response regulator transcription factor [Chloroflexi bacterium]|nr:response regulator transcription factor [Chloroflexota bacterium]